MFAHLITLCTAGNIAGVEKILQVDSARELLNVQEQLTGFTPLMYAATKGDRVMSELLIEHGATSLRLAANGQSALHLVAMGTSPENAALMRMLLDKGGHRIVNKQDNEKRTALHLAAVRGSSQMIEALIKAGADTRLKDKDGKTAADLTVDPGIKEQLKCAEIANS